MIAALQAEVAGWLRADPDFSGAQEVPILTERQGDWLDQLDRSVKTLLGLAIVVTVPAIARQTDHPLSIDAAVTLHIWENVVLNMAETGRRLPAPDAALRALGALVGRVPAGGWSPLVLRTLRLAEAATGGLLMYELSLSTGIQLRTTRVD